MAAHFDRRKSLQELEQDDWGEAKFNSSLVTTIHRLRRKALLEFTVEDLRVMILQGIGLSHLIPLALEQLEQEPLAAGDYYAGDLLHAVLQVDRAFWAIHPDLKRLVRKIIGRIDESLPSLYEITSSIVIGRLLADRDDWP